jgi:hypothetical protein
MTELYSRLRSGFDAQPLRLFVGALQRMQVAEDMYLAQMAGEQRTLDLSTAGDGSLGEGGSGDAEVEADEPRAVAEQLEEDETD